MLLMLSSCSLYIRLPTSTQHRAASLRIPAQCRQAQKCCSATTWQELTSGQLAPAFLSLLRRRWERTTVGPETGCSVSKTSLSRTMGGVRHSRSTLNCSSTSSFPILANHTAHPCEYICRRMQRPFSRQIDALHGKWSSTTMPSS